MRINLTSRLAYRRVGSEFNIFSSGHDFVCQNVSIGLIMNDEVKHKFISRGRPVNIGVLFGAEGSSSSSNSFIFGFNLDEVGKL